MTAQPISISAISANAQPATEHVDITMRRNHLPAILSRLTGLKKPQVEKVYARAKKRGEPFGKAAIALGLAKRDDVKAAIAIQFGYHFDKTANIKVPPALISVGRPYSPLADEFRRLRTGLLTSADGQAGKMIAVAGVTPDTGSSFVAANLAVSLAQLGRKTLLVDARLRNPQMATLFATHSEFGIEHIAAGETELVNALAPSCIRNLSLLTAPEPCHDPQEVFSSQAFAHFLGEAGRTFESVVIDTATGTRALDGKYIWALAQSVLLVARRNKTRISEVRAINRQVSECGAEIAGTVLMG